jgi:hypothetical protein
LQRTIDQIRADKELVERKLKNAETRPKTMATQHRDPSVPTVSKNNNDDESSLDLITVQDGRNSSRHHHRDEDGDELSESDSDIVEMRQTMKELRDTQREHLSEALLNKAEDFYQPLSSRSEYDPMKKVSLLELSSTLTRPRSPTLSLDELKHSLRMATTYPTTNFPSYFNWTMQPLRDRSSPIEIPQKFDKTSSFSPKTYPWHPKSSLVTREAVIKAARSVFNSKVVDELTRGRSPSPY